jgi:hypothetical protein
MTDPPKTTVSKPKPPVGVPATVFAASDYAAAVPLAGLLAHDPSLASAELTPAEWRKKLDAYSKSPRP